MLARARRFGILIFAAWLVPALLSGFNTYVQNLLDGRPPDWRWVLFNSTDWLLYAVLTPVVFRASRRFPLERPHLGNKLLDTQNVIECASRGYGVPRIQQFEFDEPGEGARLEFRLVYKGRLPAETNTSRVKDKHRIRKIFHAQLRELWKKDAVLARQLTDRFRIITTPDNAVFTPPGTRQIYQLPPGDPSGEVWVEHVANIYKICGFRFVPLIRKENGFTCALDILFLRRGHPGELITQGGDIDNRVKVLFDSLKTPANCAEIQSEPDSDEDPFYCLLEDDSLITRVSITTDRLLTPKEEGENESQVELIIHVTVIDPGAVFGVDGLV